jgi:hypothetical protein
MARSEIRPDHFVEDTVKYVPAVIAEAAGILGAVTKPILEEVKGTTGFHIARQISQKIEPLEQTFSTTARETYKKPVKSVIVFSSA